MEGDQGRRRSDFSTASRSGSSCVVIIRIPRPRLLGTYVTTVVDTTVPTGRRTRPIRRRIFPLIEYSLHIHRSHRNGGSNAAISRLLVLYQVISTAELGMLLFASAASSTPRSSPQLGSHVGNRSRFSPLKSPMSLPECALHQEHTACSLVASQDHDAPRHADRSRPRLPRRHDCSRSRHTPQVP
jgi:hypothetical protein